jgi:hypothetical protein
MSHRSLRSGIAVLVLALILVAPWASASQPRGRRVVHPAEAASISMSWNHLAQILQRLFTGLWAKNGCRMDPFGRPVCEQDPDPTSQSQGEAGCQVDPNGGCVSGH